MKKALLLLAICCSSPKLFAQDKNDIGKIPLSIVMENKATEDYPKTEPEIYAHLVIKMAQIVTASGMASDGVGPTFAIFPTFTINESKVAEGGMESIHVVNAELTLYIKEIDNGLVIGSYITKLKGSGRTELAAALNAVNSISPSDKEYKTFIQESKDKIMAYYASHCDQILASADNSAARGDYAEALETLLSIPQEAKSCYEAAQKKSVGVYKEYQKKECAELVLNAKAYAAARNYAEALDLLRQVDPTSPCSKEANELIASTGKKVDAEEKKQWDALLKVWGDEVSMENHPIDAMKEIAVAQYKKDLKNNNKSYHSRKKN